MSMVNHGLDRKGIQFYAFNFEANIHKNLSNIHKVMMLCAKWHSQGVKGYWVMF